MAEPPETRFLSLFVSSLDTARQRYANVLGVEPAQQLGPAPAPHPFAAAGPVVFELGPVTLALYEADPKRGTHPGDVGIGLTTTECVEAVAGRATARGGRVFFGPARLPEDGREMAVFVLPDRHFFELLEKRPGRKE
jgi:hypothetical protein